MTKRMTICIDTREQKPLDFSPFDVRTKEATLWPGDYTVAGAAAYCAFERKSVADLIGTMVTGYSGWNSTTPRRFNCELMALASIVRNGGVARVIVEPDGVCDSAFTQICRHDYRANVDPANVLGFVNAIRYGWGVPVDLTESRAQSAEIVYRFGLAAYSVKQARTAQERAVADAAKWEAKNAIQMFRM